MTSTLINPTVLQRELLIALPDFACVAWQEEVDSTNAVLMRHARDSSARQTRPTLLGARFQTHGKGRAGRKWENYQDASLMFSCAFDVFVPSNAIPALSPISGIVACEQLRANLPSSERDHLLMKWPNDIYYNDAKLSGILVESTRPVVRHHPDHFVLVVGIGINLSKAAVLSQELNRSIADWTTILDAHQLRQTESLAVLVARIAKAWQLAFQQYQEQGMQPFLDRYQAVDYLYGKEVNVEQHQKILASGVASGMNEQGCLLVQTPQGTIYPVVIGDISIKGASYANHSD